MVAADVCQHPNCPHERMQRGTESDILFFEQPFDVAIWPRIHTNEELESTRTLIWRSFRMMRVDRSAFHRTGMTVLTEFRDLTDALASMAFRTSRSELGNGRNVHTSGRPAPTGSNEALLRSVSARAPSRSASHCCARLRSKQAADDARSKTDGTREFCYCRTARVSSAFEGTQRTRWTAALWLRLVDKLSPRRIGGDVSSSFT